MPRTNCLSGYYGKPVSRGYSFGSKIDTYRSLSLRDLQDELQVAEEEYERKLAMTGRDQATLDLLAREYKENTLDLLLQVIKEKTIPRLANRERGLNTTSISERARIRQREMDLEREQVYRRESQQLAKMRECKANCNVMFGKRKKVTSRVTTTLTSDIKYLRSLR